MTPPPLHLTPVDNPAYLVEVRVSSALAPLPHNLSLSTSGGLPNMGQTGAGLDGERGSVTSGSVYRTAIKQNTKKGHDSKADVFMG